VSADDKSPVRDANDIAAFEQMMAENGVVEGTACPDCDQPIVFHRAAVFSMPAEDPTQCNRLYPFCTNHAHKVDWRARAQGSLLNGMTDIEKEQYLDELIEVAANAMGMEPMWSAKYCREIAARQVAAMVDYIVALRKRREAKRHG
jgi:hypothetical protein